MISEQCKQCGKSLGMVYYCEYNEFLEKGYCDKQCFLESEEFKTDIGKINMFLKSLNIEQKSLFKDLWESGKLEDIYDNYIADLVVEKA